ncbi:MAG: hypothetical protein JWM37_773 [Candidatus Saccharibacteria bacterium]|nr:hypothetical protein [Candidatus Saccharibacteria bacterium]
MTDNTDLIAEATDVLRKNDQGGYTMPAPHLYPHQWLWDSCFIAIGLRHLDVDRAQAELRSLLRGQWNNGMLPNMIMSDAPAYAGDRNVWRSWLNPDAPSDVATSGITQPPMLAEAVVQVGLKLSLPERRTWYKQMLPGLVAYHEWLYRERDPHHEGLVILLHPWESGLDNTPPWMYELHEHLMPFWVRALDKMKLTPLLGFVRRDTWHVAPGQRFQMTESLALFDAQIRLRRKAYQTNRILDHSLFAIEDLAFNSMLIRANEQLKAIATTLRQPLSPGLTESMDRTAVAFDDLWDPYTGQYYPRDFVSHNLIKQSSVATLLPLYAGHISKERAAELVKLIESEHLFGPAYPLPSAPVNSPYFDADRYWQGPSWLNVNWMVIDGLKRYGYHDHAHALTESSLEMVRTYGCNEYFNPLTGEPLGAKDFSWTAALAIDLASD